MKKIAIVLFLATVLIASSIPVYAGSDRDLDITADVLLVRPISLAATVVGTAVFIVSLPFTIPSGSVGAAADTLVAQPFKYTFARPVGNYNENWEAAKSRAMTENPNDAPVKK